MQSHHRSQSALGQTLLRSALVGSTALVSLSIGSASVRADCDPSSPTSGGTVVCSGDSSTGVQGAPGVDDVTVDILDGAIVDVTGASVIAIRGQGDGWTVNNDGTVTSTWRGVSIETGLVNNTGTISGEDYAVHVRGASGTLINDGILTSQNRHGVVISGAATVTNSGTISGSQDPDSHPDVNYGGLYVGNGGHIANLETGLIEGAYGVIALGSTVIENAGSIRGELNIGVQMSGGGLLTNSGEIHGGQWGVWTASGTSTEIVNSGTISSGTSDAIRLVGSGSVTNTATGIITGADYGIRAMGGSAASNVVNSGQITGLGGHGVALLSGGSVMNDGSIQAADGYGAVIVQGGEGSVTNLEGASLQGGHGVILHDGGVVENRGSIAGQDGALPDLPDLSALGVQLSRGGSVFNHASGTIEGEIGIGIYDDVSGTGNVVINHGSITGSEYAVLFADTDLFGNAVSYDSHLTNFGQISGDVQMGAGNSYLAIATGSNIDGSVDAGGGSGEKVLSLIGDGADTYDGSFTGFDRLEVNADGGTWTLQNDQTYNDGARVASGTLLVEDALTADLTVLADGVVQIGTGGTSGELNGDAQIDGTLAFNRLDVYTYGGVLTGTGNLVQRGAGTLIIEEAQAFTGATIIEQGSLLLAPGGALPEDGDLIVNAGEFDLDGQDQTIGSLSGAGGQVTLGNDPANPGSLTVNQSINTTFNGNITGEGELGKTGSGTLILNGFNDFSGPTDIGGGTLIVGDANSPGAAITGDVFVGPDGTLGGHGSVGNTVVSGTLSPGASIGTLTVTGDATFNPGSSFAVEVDGQGNSDLLIVTGTATVDGGTVVASQFGPSMPQPGRYTILEAGTLVVNQPFALASALDTLFIDTDLVYSANSIDLALLRNNVAFVSVAGTANQAATAVAAEQLGQGNAVHDGILSIRDVDTARQAFDNLSGEVHATTLGALFDNSQHVRTGILNRLRNQQPAVLSSGMPAAALGYDKTALPHMNIEAEPAPAFDWRSRAAWLQGYGGTGERDGDGNAAGADVDSWGTMLGFDLPVSEDLTFGLAAGYQRDRIRIGARNSSADVDTWSIAGYAAWQHGAIRTRGGAAFSWHDIDTSRFISVPGIAGNAEASYDGWTGQVFGEVGYQLGINGFDIEPFVGLAYVHTETDGFGEAGAGAANLLSGGDEISSLISTVGVQASTTLEFANGTTVRPHGSVAWAHAFSDVVPRAGLSFTGGPSEFQVIGAGDSRNAALVDAGLEFGITEQASAVIGYSGFLSDDVDSHALRGGLEVRF